MNGSNSNGRSVHAAGFIHTQIGQIPSARTPRAPKRGTHFIELYSSKAACYKRLFRQTKQCCSMIELGAFVPPIRNPLVSLLEKTKSGERTCQLCRGDQRRSDCIWSRGVPRTAVLLGLDALMGVHTGFEPNHDSSLHRSPATAGFFDGAQSNKSHMKYTADAVA